jgi:hypothetical protein
MLRTSPNVKLEIQPVSLGLMFFKLLIQLNHKMPQGMAGEGVEAANIKSVTFSVDA